MASETVNDAIAKVTDIMSTVDYADKEVFIIIPNIQLANASTSDEYMRGFKEISDFAQDAEPGALKFCALRPRGQEKSNQVFALEHFDSQDSLAQHRECTHVKTMLHWLQTSNPNGHYPLPIPVSLRIMPNHFVRPDIRETRDPFITMTQIGFEPSRVAEIEAGINAFCEQATDIEDVLMVLPGKTDNEAWITTAYKSKKAFEDMGLVQKGFELGSIRSWDHHFLELNVGFLLR